MELNGPKDIKGVLATILSRVNADGELDLTAIVTLAEKLLIPWHISVQRTEKNQ